MCCGVWVTGEQWEKPAGWWHEGARLVAGTAVTVDPVPLSSSDLDCQEWGEECKEQLWE